MLVLALFFSIICLFPFFSETTFVVLAFFFLFLVLFVSGGASLSEYMLEWGYGNGLILLSLWLGAGSLLLALPKSMKKAYLMSILLIVLSVAICFSSSSIFFFFLFFELTFFPVGLMIIIWGYNRERMSSLVYMLFFSLIGSSLHLFSLMYFFFSTGGASFDHALSPMFSNEVESLLWFYFFFFLFLIKSPLFLCHMWLTKAHVEAPTSASMLLAGLLLKLGSYGMMVYSLVVSPSSFVVFGFQVLGLWGSILGCMLCYRSQNLKLMIALSSVCHMSISVSFFFCYSELTYDLMLMNSVSHGLCASGLFCWCGGQYGRSSTQNPTLLQGGRLLDKETSMLVLLLLALNCGIPPFLSFWVELMGFVSLFLKWSGLWVFLVGLSLLSLMFSCIIGFNFFFSTVNEGALWGGGWSKMESAGLWLHLIPSVLLFFFSCLLF
nr:NADH dehydrogenase subunit 4 [Ficopomatus enigmaticus]